MAWWPAPDPAALGHDGDVRAGERFPGGTGGAGGYGGRQGFTGTGGQGQGQEQQQQPAAGTTETSAATTEGTVKLVNGTTVYIVTSDGRTITVKTSDGTTVQLATDGALSDLAEGDTVTVAGATAGDSSVTATTITEQQK